MIEKQEIISKLQDDLNNKNNEILKTEPKNYYSTLFGQSSNDQAKIIEEKNVTKKAEGKIVKIIGREKDTIVGVFQKSKNFGFEEKRCNFLENGQPD